MQGEAIPRQVVLSAVVLVFLVLPSEGFPHKDLVMLHCKLPAHGSGKTVNIRQKLDPKSYIFLEFTEFQNHDLCAH